MCFTHTHCLMTSLVCMYFSSMCYPSSFVYNFLCDRFHSRYGLFAPETLVPTKPKVFTAQAFMALLRCPLGSINRFRRA